MPQRRLRLSEPTILVVKHLLSSEIALAGADLSRATGIGPGTLYPLLGRLEKASWVEGKWESASAETLQRPIRKLYRLTDTGRNEYRDRIAVDVALPTPPKTDTPSMSNDADTTSYYQRSYWRHDGDKKVSCSQAEATRIEISTRNGPYTSSFEFAYPGEQMKAYELVKMLETAFKRGGEDARENIRRCIGL